MNKNILRSYDIRGKYPLEVNEDIAFNIGYKYGCFLKNEYQKIIVGSDIRLSSESLKNEVIKGINKSGLDVIDIGFVTTPMCAFATIKFETAAIMVTASHNPKDENGFKFFLKNNLSMPTEKLQVFYDTFDDNIIINEEGTIEKENIFDDYKKALFNGITFGENKLKVVVDPGNGAGSLFIKEILKDIPFNITYICDTPDGNFPNHHPDPAVKENMQMLKEKVKEIKADFGVAYDGDADRIGMVDENGSFLSADKIMIIFLKHLNIKKTLYDVKCTMALKKVAEKLGINSICFKTGAINTKNEINRQKILFGGEFSGHLVFNDKYVGIDDGIYASIRLMELFSNIETSVSYELKDIPVYISSGEEKIKTNDENKFDIVEKVKQEAIQRGYFVKTVDGIRIEGKNYMVVLRASNTGANLTFIVEAYNKKLYDEKYKEFIELIQKYNK